MRKVGENLHRMPYTGTLTGIKTGSLAVTIPAPLMQLLSLSKGQRFKVKVTAGKVTMVLRRISSSTAKAMPCKRSGADRIRFESKWNRLVRSLNKSKRKRTP
jgi:antitoxin component of MazEF toxin-antitoxin module